MAVHPFSMGPVRSSERRLWAAARAVAASLRCAVEPSYSGGRHREIGRLVPFLFFALTLAGASLASDQRPQWRDVYLNSPVPRRPLLELRISVREKERIVLAALTARNEWCARSPALCIPARIVQDGEENLIVVTWLPEGMAGYANWEGQQGEPVMYLSELHPLITIRHELGHLLCGCAGHPHNWGAMDERSDYDRGSLEPTADDAEMVLHFRARAMRAFAPAKGK